MIKIIELQDVKLTGINSKYISKRYVLSSGYRKTKELIKDSCVDIPKIEGNFKLKVILTTYKDIDALIKPIMDSIEDAGIIENDRYCLGLNVIKYPGKRGGLESLEVYIEEIK